MDKDDKDIIMLGIKLVEDNVPADLRQIALKTTLNGLWSADIEAVELAIKNSVKLINELDIADPYKEVVFDYLYRSNWSRNKESK